MLSSEVDGIFDPWLLVSLFNFFESVLLIFYYYYGDIFSVGFERVWIFIGFIDWFCVVGKLISTGLMTFCGPRKPFWDGVGRFWIKCEWGAKDWLKLFCAGLSGLLLILFERLKDGGCLELFWSFCDPEDSWGWCPATVGFIEGGLLGKFWPLR